MQNILKISDFCKTGQKDPLSSFLLTTGWSPENPNIHGYQLNTLFNEIIGQLNFLMSKGLSFWQSDKPYGATENEIDIVRHGNKIYFAKQNSNSDGISPKVPSVETNFWGVLLDLDNPFVASNFASSNHSHASYLQADSKSVLHASDALRISGSTISLFKGDGSSEDITLPASGLQDTAHSFTANGYQKLSNGLIIQWGAIASGGSSDSSLTFPIAFPNSCIYAVCNPRQGGLITHNAVSYTATTLNYSRRTISGASVVSDTSNGHYFAIGY